MRNIKEKVIKAALTLVEASVMFGIGWIGLIGINGIMALLNI